MEYKGLLVGGVLPALAFGMTGLLQKAASRFSPGLGPYLLCVGCGVLLVGIVYTWFSNDRTILPEAGMLSLGIGLSWGVGMVLVAIGLSHFAMPLSKLAPLYNMNTLVVVLLALVIFSEAREVAVPRLLLGTAMIMTGAVVVAKS